MRRKIFISYRRVDSGAHVQGIAQYLANVFGRKRVVLDVDTISGADFPRTLKKWLSECKVLLVLIGPGWLNARDDKGRRRLIHGRLSSAIGTLRYGRSQRLRGALEGAGL